MKKILFTLLVALTVNAFGQISNSGGEIAGYYSNSDFSPAEKDVSVTIIGTVMLKDDVWVIHGTTGSNDAVQDYYPGNLTKPFKIDGLRVSVNATLDPIPEGVRMAGTPITIVTIQKL